MRPPRPNDEQRSTRPGHSKHERRANRRRMCVVLRGDRQVGNMHRLWFLPIQYLGVLGSVGAVVLAVVALTAG